VWRAARDGRRAEPVTHDAADVQSFTLSSDGGSLLYRVGAPREEIMNAEQQEFDRGIRIDDTIMAGQGVYRSSYINGRLASVRLTDGSWLEAGLLAERPGHEYIVDLATSRTHEATQAAKTAFAAVLPVTTLKAGAATGLVARAADSNRIAFIALDDRSGDLEKQKRLMVTENALSPQAAECPAAACRHADIVGLAWRPGRAQVIFTVTDHDRARGQSLYSWDLAQDSVSPIAHATGLFNGGGNSESSCSIGARLAACVAADPNAPPHIESIDLDSGERRILFDPNQALAASASVRVESLHWTDDQGHPFTGQFFPAAARAPAPLFVTYYTCPGYLRGGTPGEEWPLASLAGAGIAALCINRASEFPTDATVRYDLGLRAVRSAVELLRRRGNIDPTKVGMGGLSFGTEVTMWVAMKSNLLSAASVTSPVLSPTFYWFIALHRGDYLKNGLQRLWGVEAPEKTPERWRELSPTFNLGKIHAPVLMQMPEQEYLETMEYFVPLARTARAEMYVFPNESHQKVLPRHKLAAYERNLDWFRFWLRGEKDPTPEKRDQYARWEQMRARQRADREHAERGASQ
jgi:dipeptidyl aminopeptidase/acylaminoacyl peptidase